MRIRLLEGDITKQAVDAVVNAANTALRPGGGVDGAITRAAGAEALADRKRRIAELGDPPLPTGTAIATIAGDLPARWIIHTAGPVFSGSERDRQLLRACHRSCLAMADELGARSLAFPAISCGIYGYPPDQAAQVALDAVMDAETEVEEIQFVLFDQEMLEVFRAAIRVEGSRRGWDVDDERCARQI
jgi:O-acetyl-ADP-ribose deacetylase (regulator of RNase III)